MSQSALISFMVARIIKLVTARYGLLKGDIASRRRQKSISAARRETWWLARELTPMSYPEIGKYTGGFDHTSVLYGIDVMQQRLAADDHYAAELERVKQELRDNE